MILTITLNPALDQTIVLPRIKFGETNRICQCRVDPGGKGINVAKVLKGLGASVVTSGFIGGQNGRSILESLNQMGISAKFVPVNQETRTNIKIRETELNRETEINAQGFVLFPEDLERLQQELEEILQGTQVLVISGSIPHGLPENTTARLIRQARKAGVLPVLDTNGPSLLQGIQARPFLIKPNLTELEQVLGRQLQDTEEVLEAARQLQREGAENVLVSMGREGAILVTGTDFYLAKPPVVTVKSTVGAGDSMVAAFLFRFLQKKGWAESLRYATAAGTATATLEGSQVCTPEKIEALLQSIEMRIWQGGWRKIGNC